MYKALFVLVFFCIVFCGFSQYNADSLRTVAENDAFPDTVRWHASSELIWQEYMFSQPDTAAVLADELYEEAKASGNRAWQANAMNTKAISFAVRGELDSAIMLLEKCVSIRRSLGHVNQIAGLKSNLGNMYADLGDLDNAVSLYEQSYELALQMQDSGLMASNLTNLGIAYQDLGQVGRASEKLYRSIKIREALGDQYGLAKAYAPLADVFAFLGDTAGSLEMRERAAEIYKEIGDDRSLAVVYQSMASILASLGELDEAINLSTESLELLKNVGDMRSVSNSSRGLGVFLLKAGRTVESVVYLERSVLIDDSAGYDGLLVHSLNALANLRKEQSRRAEAQELYERSLGLSKDLGILDAQAVSAQSLYDLYKEQGRSKDALAMYELAQRANAEINDEALVRSALRDQFEYTYRSQLAADSIALAQERALRDLETSSNKRTRLFLIGGLVLILGFAVFAWDRYRKTRRQKAIIEESAAQLAEMDAVKNRFFTNISHEFRTPLTLILGPVRQLLDARRKRNEQQDVKELSVIARNSERLQELIDQILELNKLEAGKVNASMVQGDIVALLDHLFSALRSLGEAKGIRMDRTGRKEPLIADHDREMLTKIVQNLVSNAAKFTPSGGSITLDVASTGNEFTFSVRDTGKGISPEDLSHVFDRFYQSAETPDDQVGTGVGLALTRELVATLKGNITVESERGEGSMFTVTLPINRNAPLTEGPLPEVSVTTGPSNDEMPVERADATSEDAPLVLIVEDNPDMAEHVAQCLGADITKRIAENGAIGTELATELVPDLIVSDVMMPEKDGFTLCEELKNDERTSHIPIIMLTARADVEDRISGLSRGADDYLSKPFNAQELQLRVRNLLDMRRKLIARYAHGGPVEVANDVDLALEDKFIIKIRETLHAHLDDSDFGPNQIGEELGVSRSQFFRKVKALTGESPSNYVRKLRLVKAHELLKDPELRVSEVAFMVGFNDPKYFSRSYTKEFGVAPSAERPSD